MHAVLFAIFITYSEESQILAHIILQLAFFFTDSSQLAPAWRCIASSVYLTISHREEPY